MRARVTSTLALVGILGAGCATVGESWRHYPPEFEPKSVTSVPNYQRISYPNGVNVMVAETRELPLVSIAVVSRAGSLVDPSGQKGLAAVSWNTALRGAGGRDFRGMQRAFDAIGATPTLRVTPDGVVIQVTVLQDRFATAAALLSDIVRRPNLREADLERVEQRLSYRRDEQDPDLIVARRVLARSIFGDHPAGRVDVEPSDFDIRSVRAFHKYYVGPESTAVVVAGAVKASEVARRFGGLLGSWKSPVHLPSRPPPPTPRTPEGIVFVPNPGSPEAVIGFGQAVPQFAGREATALQAAVGSFGGEIYGTLRRVNGYSYATLGGHERLLGSGWYYSIAPVPAEAAGSAIEAIRDALPEVRKQYDYIAYLRDYADRYRQVYGRNPDLRRVQRLPLPILSAKIGAYANSVWRTDTVGDLARAVAHLFLYDLPDDQYARELSEVAALTEADVKAVIDRYFRPDAYHVVVVGDPKVVLPQLKNLGSVVQVDTTGRVVDPTPVATTD